MTNEQAIKDFEETRKILKETRDDKWEEHISQIDLAIEALEKQTPKKPKITLQNGFCGKCGIAWGHARLIEEQHCGYRYFKYCPTCGQAIDWGEE